jgi:N-acetylglucosamine kinase-like BadF-type ATPase
VSAPAVESTGTDRLVLAVDGGNAKTDLALLEPGGALLSLIRGGPSNSHYLGVDGCVQLLDRLFDDALGRAGIGSRERPRALAACILLAGADLPEEQLTLRDRIEQMGWSDRLVVDNDTLALLRAGTDRGWGIAVVCGAGINCLGRAADGREVRFLSLGEISGDWGGGADVGRAGLVAATRSADGRGPRTQLERAVPAHFGLSDPPQLSRALHLQQIPKARLGELAPVVLELSGEDPVAAAIVQRLGDEVIAFASAALRRLELIREDPDVVLGGRLLRSVSPSVVEAIASGVREVAPKARVLVSPSEPIVGAALLSLDLIGAGVVAKQRARAELDAAVPTSADARPQVAVTLVRPSGRSGS